MFRRIIALAGFLSLFALTAAPATLVATIGVNIRGGVFGIYSWITPADSNGAIGPNHFVEFINGRFAIYSKTNGSLITFTSDLNFWAAAGVSLQRNWKVADPRIIYDPVSHRWFASQIDFDPTGAVNANHFLLAVSATADPTGTWKGVSISSDPGGTYSADFPTLGLDSQGVYLSGNFFDAAGNPVGATLLSLPKAPLLGGTPSISGRTWFGVLNYTNRGYILQPAVCLDGSSGANVLATGGLGYDYTNDLFETDYTLVATKIQNPAGPGAATLSAASVLNIPGYTAPPYATQPYTSTNLDTGDSRFSGAVSRVGNVLFAVHSTQVSGRAAIRWYRINATNNVVMETGTIADPIQDLFFPSIAANTNGAIVIACNGSSFTNTVNCYAALGQTVNGLTSFGGLILLVAGQFSYQNPDSSGYSRWGDYSTTSVDPSDPTQFWTIQMFPFGQGWATQITQLLTAPLRLTITPAGQNVLLSWPSTAVGFQLQCSTNLGVSASWFAVSQTPLISSNTCSVLVPVTSPQHQFFRLGQSR